MPVLPSSLSATLTPRSNARHAKPSTVGPTIAAGGLTAAFVVADGAAASAAQAAPAAAVGMATASANDFARLRQCEAGGNYRINTGNGYYGAYQFDARTWRGLGYSGLPHQAAPAVQDDAAAKLQSQRGWSPWPGCARKLGLNSGRGSYTPTHAAQAGKHAAPKKAATKKAAPKKAEPKKVVKDATPQRASRTRTLAPRTAPPLDRAMTLADRSSYRLVVAQWQARMAERGWQVTVDGHFGPQSARIADRFAAEKGLTTPAGTVDTAVMAAAWTAPLVGTAAPATPTAIPALLTQASAPGRLLL